MKTNMEPGDSRAEIVSPSEGQPRYVVEALHLDKPRRVAYLFFYSQKSGAARVRLVAFSSLGGSPSPVEPPISFMTRKEAEVVARWLRRTKCHKDVRIVSGEPVPGLPADESRIERSGGTVQEPEGRHIPPKKYGWSGSPLYVLSTDPTPDPAASQGRKTKQRLM